MVYSRQKIFILSYLSIFILLSALFYKWDLLFFDSAYYLRIGFDGIKNYAKLQDRMINHLFIYFTIKLSGGPSMAAFFILRNCYRLIMAASLFIWWLILRRFTYNKEQRIWLALLLVSSPVFLYTLNQIVPDHFQLLFNGLAILIFLKGVEIDFLPLQFFSGVAIYLAFLSRSDALLLPASLFAALLAFAYKPRRFLFKHLAVTMASCLPLFLMHFVSLAADHLNVAPMLNLIVAFGRTTDIANSIKYQLIKAGGCNFIFAVFSVMALRHDRNVRIIFLATVLAYIPILVFILMGFSMIERHTIQGALLLSFLAAVGLQDIISRLNKVPVFLMLIAMCLAIFANIICANHMTGGVDVKGAYTLIDRVEKKYPGAILLVSDDPTYFFLHFNYPVKNWIYYAYAGYPTEKKTFVEYFKKKYKDTYISGREDLVDKQASGIFYVGIREFSALGDDRKIIFRECPLLGTYKGLPVQELILN